MTLPFLQADRIGRWGLRLVNTIRNPIGQGLLQKDSIPDELSGRKKYAEKTHLTLRHSLNMELGAVSVVRNVTPYLILRQNEYRRRSGGISQGDVK